MKKKMIFTTLLITYSLITATIMTSATKNTNYSSTNIKNSSQDFEYKNYENFMKNKPKNVLLSKNDSSTDSTVHNSKNSIMSNKIKPNKITRVLPKKNNAPCLKKIFVNKNFYSKNNEKNSCKTHHQRKKSHFKQITISKFEPLIQRPTTMIKPINSQLKNHKICTKAIPKITSKDKNKKRVPSINLLKNINTKIKQIPPKENIQKNQRLENNISMSNYQKRMAYNEKLEKTIKKNTYIHKDIETKRKTMENFMKKPKNIDNAPKIKKPQNKANKKFSPMNSKKETKMKLSQIKKPKKEIEDIFPIIYLGDEILTDRLEDLEKNTHDTQMENLDINKEKLLLQGIDDIIKKDEMLVDLSNKKLIKLKKN